MHLKIQQKTLILIVLLALLFLLSSLYWYFSIANEPVPQPAPHYQPKPIATSPAPAGTPRPHPIADNLPEQHSIALVDASLLEQEIPSDPSLIKDEIAHLTDLDAQLIDKKNILHHQLQAADQLISLKQQQLADLEQLLHTE